MKKLFLGVLVAFAFGSAIFLVLMRGNAQFAEDDLEQLFQGAFGPEVTVLMKENFSEQYDQMVSQTMRVIREDPNNREAAFAQGVNVTRDLILKQGSAAVRAPLADLRAHIGLYRGMLASMSAAPLVCANFAYNGGGMLTADDVGRFDPQIFMPQFASTLRMILAGRDTQTTHASVGPTDVGASIDAWQAQTTIPEAARRVFLTENWRHPDFCTGWSDYLEYIQHLEGPTGDRLVVFWVAVLLGLPAET